MVFGYFGQIFYIGLLFTNAIAILNEDRFLAKSEYSSSSVSFREICCPGATVLS